MERKAVRVVGFDCAEERHVAVLLNGEGEEELVVEVENGRGAIEEALSRLVLRLPRGTGLRVVVESQRSHGRLVADCARGLGLELVEVNPTVLERFRKVEGLSNKDDTIDAFLLARITFFGHGGVREAVEYTPQERALQRWMNLWDELKKERTRALFRLRALVLELVPELLRGESELPELDSKSMLGILTRWPGLEGLERAQRRSIVAILREHRCRKDLDAVAEALREMAKAITMPEVEREVVTVLMQHEVARILEYDGELKKLGAIIEEAVRREPAGEWLLEMPGVGVTTAAVLLAWYRPVAVGMTEAQAAMYSGLTPVSRRSGKSKGRDRLGRRVNKKVLRVLYLSAVASLKASAIDRAYYEKKRRDYAGHPREHTAATIALARQRVKVMYKILVEGERYNKEKLIARYLEREHPREAA
jgi:transposase